MPIEGTVAIPDGSSVANTMVTDFNFISQVFAQSSAYIYQVTLNGLEYEAIIRADGSFKFPDVLSGNDIVFFVFVSKLSFNCHFSRLLYG